MKCLKCNTDIPESAKFCPYCGAVVKPDTEPRADQVEIKGPDLIEDENSVPGPVVVQKSKSNPGCLILILGSMIIGLGIFIAASNMPSWKFEELTGVWVLLFMLLILISAIVYSSVRNKNNS